VTRRPATVNGRFICRATSRLVEEGAQRCRAIATALHALNLGENCPHTGNPFFAQSRLVQVPDSFISIDRTAVCLTWLGTPR